MNLEELKTILKDVTSNYNERDNKLLKSEFMRLKKIAIEDNNEKLAKDIWCYEQVLKIQELYVIAFQQLKAHSFYEGWCSLERTEIEYSFLKPHFNDPEDIFKTNIIAKHVKQYQSLFPYKVFFSPEILEVKKICNICKKPINPRKPCGHRVGEIYRGEMCVRIVTKAEIISIAIVGNPEQKYSVAFFEDGDHYNYRAVQYVVDKLESPFHYWEMFWTKRRHPHSFFKDISPNDKCPCGSDKEYKDCCFNESGVLKPHCEIIFSVPPKEKPQIEYIY